MHHAMEPTSRIYTQTHTHHKPGAPPGGPSTPSSRTYALAEVPVTVSLQSIVAVSDAMNTFCALLRWKSRPPGSPALGVSCPSAPHRARAVRWLLFYSCQKRTRTKSSMPLIPDHCLMQEPLQWLPIR